VVLSDLADEVDSWRRPLRMLAARADVVVAQVVDRREVELPAVGVLQLVDPESGRQETVALTARTRARYAQATAERAEAQRRAVLSAGAAHVAIRTDSDWLPQLARFLATRRRTRTAPRPRAGSS
jgi:hypothetical protein